MNNKIVMITGACYSGKTKYAIELARKLNGKTVYIAALVCPDNETREQFNAINKTIPSEWQFVEESKNVDTVLMNIAGLSEVVVLDSLAVLSANLLGELKNQKQVRQRIEALLKLVRDSELNAIIVTDEPGNRIDLENKTGQNLMKLIGSVNQLIAQSADEIYLMVSGVPVKIK